MLMSMESSQSENWAKSGDGKVNRKKTTIKKKKGGGGGDNETRGAYSTHVCSGFLEHRSVQKSTVQSACQKLLVHIWR